MNELAQKLHITNTEGWYNISYRDILEHGGKDLLLKYNNSPTKLLRNLYPEYKWNVSKFTKLDVTSSHRYVMEELAKKLNIVDQQGWYKITRKIVTQHAGQYLTKQYKTLLHLMNTLFPEYQTQLK